MGAFSREPKLTLVGAGPGDPELITLKGIHALQNADVVLYDALVDVSLLDYAPGYAEKIYVGKRPGHHSLNQDEINQYIVQYALSHGHVVRLKGGDPFVFGRGHEEIQYARQFGIPTLVIPGISSAIGVPASAGIPVTRRSMSESFWVITATKEDHALSNDIRLAVQSTATVIILMGMAKLKLITELFSSAGRSELPVAIIRHGTTIHQQVLCGTINNIADRAEVHHFTSPAVIVIGEVAALGKESLLEIASTFSEEDE